MGLVALLSTLVTLFAVELALRLAAGTLLGRPSPARGLRLVGDRYPASHHPELGWVPTPGASGRDNPWRTQVTIGADGTRSTGHERAFPGPAWLAVGDSFTFGDEVDDDATWPAQLEQELGVAVRNGGVFGYGLDQIVLRAERLLDAAPAAGLVLGLLPEDVLRCEFAYRYAWKPWFDVVSGALVLRNVPVPAPDAGPPDESAPWRVLRASFLADLVFRRLDPQGWLLPESLRVHRQGVRIAPLLLERLAERARRDALPLLVVVLWIPDSADEPVRTLERRAEALDVPLLRVEPVLRAALARPGVRVETLFRMHARPGTRPIPGHMTRAGNRLVAGAIAARLRAMGAVSPAPAPRPSLPPPGA